MILAKLHFRLISPGGIRFAPKKLNDSTCFQYRSSRVGARGMEPTIRVGKIFGIVLNLGYSWFLIFIFATIVMAMQYDNHFPDWPPIMQFFWGLVTSVLFFISILGHEVAHSLVALHYGIRVHSIRLHIFGGWARLGRPPKTAVEEFAIAIAGPLSSLIFASIFGLIWKFTEVEYPPVSLLTGQLAWINLILAIFNILPSFPLDGGLVLRSIIWFFNGEYTVATRVAAYTGQIMSVFFMILGISFFMKIGLSGLWFLIIGYNLFTSSNAQLKDARIKENLKPFKVGDLTLQQLPQVNSKIHLDEFLSTYVFGNKQGCFLVVDENTVVGMVTPVQAVSVEGRMTPITTIGDVMTPLNKVEIIEPETEVMQALELMDCTETAHLPVVKNQQLEGVLSRDSLVDFIRSRFEYGVQKFAHPE
jgi:Zn-dependent protease/predicted transcriptional regulator